MKNKNYEDGVKNKKNKVEYPQGLYYKKPGYDWIDTTLSINKKEFIEWLNQQEEETIWIHQLTSKAGKKYFKKWTYSKTGPTIKEIDPVIKNNIEKDDGFWD
jgi:hypothetical protein